LKKAVLKLRDEITKDFNRECEDEGKVKIPEPVFIRHLNERLRGAKEERPKKQMVEVVFQKPDNAATLREAYNIEQEMESRQDVTRLLQRDLHLSKSYTENEDKD